MSGTTASRAIVISIETEDSVMTTRIETKTPVIKAEINTECPSVEAETEQAMPTIKTERDNETSPVQIESTDEIPEIKTERDNEASLVNLDNADAIPEIKTEHEEATPLIKTETDNEMPLIKTEGDDETTSLKTESDDETPTIKMELDSGDLTTIPPYRLPSPESSESNTVVPARSRPRLYENGRVPPVIRHPQSGPNSELSAEEFVNRLVELQRVMPRKLRKVEYLRIEYFYLPHGFLGDALRHLHLPNLRYMDLTGVVVTGSSLRAFRRNHPGVTIEYRDVEMITRRDCRAWRREH